MRTAKQDRKPCLAKRRSAEAGIGAETDASRPTEGPSRHLKGSDPVHGEVVKLGEPVGPLVMVLGIFEMFPCPCVLVANLPSTGPVSVLNGGVGQQRIIYYPIAVRQDTL